MWQLNTRCYQWNSHCFFQSIIVKYALLMKTTSFSHQSQRSLGTDSMPATPKGILKNDGTITSLKSTQSLDNLKSSSSNQLDRSNTETVPFPGYTMTPTSKILENPAEQPSSSFISSSVDGTPSTAGNFHFSLVLFISIVILNGKN